MTLFPYTTLFRSNVIKVDCFIIGLAEVRILANSALAFTPMLV
jgi:hypothetical protein